MRSRVRFPQKCLFGLKGNLDGRPAAGSMGGCGRTSRCPRLHSTVFDESSGVARWKPTYLSFKKNASTSTRDHSPRPGRPTARVVISPPWVAIRGAKTPKIFSDDVRNGHGSNNYRVVVRGRPYWRALGVGGKEHGKQHRILLSVTLCLCPIITHAKTISSPSFCILCHVHLLLGQHTFNDDQHPLWDVTFPCSSRAASTGNSHVRAHTGARVAHRHSAPASCPC